MPSYRQTIIELFELQRFAIKLGLDNIRILCNALDNPQNKYPIIHVAGTNGKGSTSFFIASILKSMGLKVGLFTSPHLIDFRERISINGRNIKKDFIISFWEKNRDLVHKHQATFFDTTTAMAFDYFYANKIDMAVIETGLGGRLDSTNIVNAEINVLTPIQFDHEKQLGNTLKEIAAEKAGIIKPQSAIFSAKQDKNVIDVVKKNLSPDNRFFYLPDLVTITVREQSLDHTLFDLHDKTNQKDYHDLQTRQLGSFQVENISLAFAVSEFYLKTRGQLFSISKFRTTLSSVIWPGRLQRVRQDPNIFFDVSHNIDGISKTLDFLSQFVSSSNLVILIGLVADKNYHQIASVVSARSNNIIITEPNTDRRLEATKLSAAFRKGEKSVKIIKDSSAAYEFSKEQITKEQSLLVIGSHYLIGSLLESLN